MRRALSLLMLFAVMLTTGCSTHSYKMFGDMNETAGSGFEDMNQTTVVESYEWKITQGDRVEISVSNQSAGNGNEQWNRLLSLSTEARFDTRDGTEGFLIPADGTVRLPLVGTVKVAGMTEHEAAEALTEAYRVYMKRPYVNVKILNQKLFVLGEVRRPGVVHVTNGVMTLFEALAYSGDLTDDAERTNVKIIRGGLRAPKVREVDLAHLDRVTMASLMLQPNDIVYVQPRGMKAYNVAIREQMPLFDLIVKMMQPFMSYTYIDNGGSFDGLF